MIAKHGRSAFLALVASCLLIATGCSPYKLQGRVFQGEASWVTVTDQATLDAEQGNPISGALVELVLDPGRLNRKPLGTARTGPNGEFSIEVDEFGAGWMEHDVGLLVSRDGYITADGFFRLPDAKRRVLVTLQRGRDDRRSFEDGHYDYREDLRRYGR